MNTFFDDLADILDPANNPFFRPAIDDSNVEDAEIIEEIKTN